MYIIKDSNRWFYTNRNDIPLNNTTKVMSVLCSALWFETDNEKYWNYFGFGDLVCKVCISAGLVGMYMISC